MAEQVIINKSVLTKIGNAIREKKGTTDLIPSVNMASEIESISTGGNIQELTEVPTEVDENSPDKIVVNGFLYEKISGGALGVWVWSDNLAGAGYGAESYNIDFVSNGETFTLLDKKNYAGYIPLYYDTTSVNGRSSWSNEAYKTIQIIGGADFENEKLLTLLNIAAQRQSEGYGYKKVVVDKHLDITVNGTYETPENVRYNSINVNIINFLQTLVTERNIDGGYCLCYGYTDPTVDFLADINFCLTKNMNFMFYSCSTLTTIPRLLNTNNVETFNSMFYYCTSLTAIPQLDTSSMKECNSMFYNCYKLTTIDITLFRPYYDASSGEDFAYGCHSLTKLIIRTMDTIPTFGTDMFTGCYHFTGTVNATYNPDGLKDGRIYVPDDKVEALKAATGWANYADIIVPLSTLVED